MPPVPLTIHWPASVSALEDITLRVDLPGLAERDPEAEVAAELVDPLYQVWWRSDLEPAEEGHYSASSSIHLPLDPPPGDWRLTVFISTTVPVNGGRTILFRSASVPLRNLRRQVRPGVVLHVPRTFTAMRYEGDEVAGMRVWVDAGGEVTLGWIPGPTEPLTQDTARMVAEATYPADGEVEVLEVEPVEWGGLPGFRFVERWSEGPAEALVVQGSDLWLYVLRVRTLSGESILPLLRDIQASFRVE